MRFLWLHTGPLSVNTYLVGAENTNEVAVIDPGGAGPVLEALMAEGLTCTNILLTHGHFDHIGGVAELKEKTGAAICIHEADAPMLESGRKSLAPMMGMRQQPVKADVLLHDGDAFDAAGLHVRVLHTPGHTPGGCCYILDNEHVLFCGDTLFYESYGRTDFPGSSGEALQRSILDGLFKLCGDYTVYCGHGDKTSLDHERACNPLSGGEFPC